MKKEEIAEKSEHVLQSEADREKPKRGASVVTYIAVLFAVAFLLLLLSYFMQQRNTEQVIQGLQSSVSTVEDLQNRNTALYRQVDQLKAKIKEYESSNQKLQSDLTEAQTQAQKQKEATNLFWQIERLYLLKQYDTCGEAIGQMEEGSLAQYLSNQNEHAIVNVSPAQEYARIKKALAQARR